MIKPEAKVRLRPLLEIASVLAVAFLSYQLGLNDGRKNTEGQSTATRLTPTASVTPEMTTTPTLSPSETPDCVRNPKPNLVVGQKGQSTMEGSALNVRRTPHKPKVGEPENKLTILANGEVFDVLEGPICDGHWFWYKIGLSDGTMGWVTDADPGGYYLLPVVASTPTPIPVETF